MERRHRKDHRAHERKARDSAEHHRHRHHHNHEPERNEKSSAKVPVQSDSKPRRHLEHRQAEPALSGDNDYVRRWLTQTKNESHANNGKSDALQKQSERNESTSKEHALGNFTHLQFGVEDNDGRRKPKRKHNSSSDSSLLEAPVRPKSRPQLFEEENEKSPQRLQQAQQYHKKRKTEPVEPDISSLSSLPSTPEETFEKKARRKTKEDRYEPKKKRSKSEKHTKKKNSKPEKKGERKKAAKKAGEDLIRNFSTKNIGQERLTIRPSHGLGLFKNGRASSPAKRRGLPDLAFSEMEFLQNSHRNDPTAKPDHITSKSRERDKRKSARRQDEISDFFKPSKAPLREIDLNVTGRASSTHAAPQESLYRKQFTAHDYQRASRRSQPMEHTDKPGRRISLDGSSVGREQSPSANYFERPPESTSKFSGKADTYVTWSETQFSPGTTAKYLHFKALQRSPTPASIRRSLRDTGIYRNTGIETWSESWDSRKGPIRLPKAEKTQQWDGTIDSEMVRSNLSLSRSASTSSSESAATDLSRRHAKLVSIHGDQRSQSPQQKSNVSTEHRDDFHEDVSNMNLKDRRTEPATSGDQRIVIEHFDPALGWHQRPISRAQKDRVSPEMPRGESERVAKSTPIDREQLARRARIKRPATTLPVNSLLEEENFGRNAFMGKAPQNMVASPRAPDDMQATAETSGAELLKPASIVSQTDNAESSFPAFQKEKVMASDHNSIQQQVDGDPTLQFSESRPPKEKDTFRPFLFNPESGLKFDDSVETHPQETFGRIENGSYMGLPLRGGWNTQAPTPANHSRTALSFLELEPLFIHQVQRRQLPAEEHLECQTQARGGNSLGLAASDLTSNLPIEDFPGGLLAHRKNDFTHQDDFYNDRLYNYGYEQEEDLTAYAHETSIWEPEEEYVDSRLNDMEMPVGQSQQPWHHYETFGGMPAEQVPVPTEEPAGQNYVSNGNEGNDPIQGFWKPQRQY